MAIDFKLAVRDQGWQVRIAVLFHFENNFFLALHVHP